MMVIEADRSGNGHVWLQVSAPEPRLKKFNSVVSSISGSTTTIGHAVMSTRLLRRLNSTVTRNLRIIEMIGVLMRIFSFSLVSWFGPQSPFLFVWAFNTADAVLLSWCALIKRDTAYTVLNVFWVGVGVVGMIRALGLTSP